MTRPVLGTDVRPLLAAAPLPTIVELRARARRRRWWRAGSAATIVLVVAALVAGVSLIGRGRGTVPVHTVYAPWVTSGVAFTDGGAGLAVQLRCATNRNICVARALSTDDLGRTWRPGRALPADAIRNGLGPVVSDAGGTALTDVSGRPVLTGSDGRSWRSVTTSAQPLAHLDRHGAWLLTTTYGRVYEPAEPGNRVLACDLAVARCGPLLHQPPMARLVSAELGTDHRLWAAGLSPAGRPILAVSDDLGRSWRTTRLPGPALDSIAVTDIEGGRAAIVGYRFAQGNLWGTRQPLSALWTTTDAGRTVRFTAPDAGRPLSADAVLLLPAGRIGVLEAQHRIAGRGVALLSSGGTTPIRMQTRQPALRLSADGGRTYAYPRGVPPGVSSLSRAPRTNELYGVDYDGQLVVSTDLGRVWRTRPIP